MRIAVTQPNFLPWLGYFELLDHIDLFIALDDVQLTRRTFMTRNRLFDHQGKVAWISEQIAACPRDTAMNRAMISQATPWWEDLARRLGLSYGAHPFWPWLSEHLVPALVPKAAETVAAYNLRLIVLFCELAGVRSPDWALASALRPYRADETPEDRMLALCHQIGATEYCNFAKGVEIGLYRPAAFAAQGVALLRQDYQHPQYPQYRDQAFQPYLSLMDALACLGPGHTAEVLRHGRRWRRMTEHEEAATPC